MLKDNLTFIHKFDAKMHHSIYNSFQDVDEILIDDSVQSTKCLGVGRWNFSVADKDYTCGIYQTLEIIRKSVFSAIENNKTSVDIALMNTQDSDICYVKEDDKCHYDKKISKKIFFKVVKPVLEEMFIKTDYLKTIKVFRERFKKFLISYKRDLIHIEWHIDDGLIMDQPAEMELQLIA